MSTTFYIIAIPKTAEEKDSKKECIKSHEKDCVEKGDWKESGQEVC